MLVQRDVCMCFMCAYMCLGVCVHAFKGVGGWREFVCLVGHVCVCVRVRVCVCVCDQVRSRRLISLMQLVDVHLKGGRVHLS